MTNAVVNPCRDIIEGLISLQSRQDSGKERRVLESGQNQVRRLFLASQGFDLGAKSVFGLVNGRPVDTFDTRLGLAAAAWLLSVALLASGFDLSGGRPSSIHA